MQVQEVDIRSGRKMISNRSKWESEMKKGKVNILLVRYFSKEVPIYLIK